MGDRKRVLVVGELNPDLILKGMPSLPKLGRELLADEMRLVMGSSSAIFAARLAALGADVEFVGKVGDDVYGHFVIEELRGYGVGVEGIEIDPGVQTGLTVSLSYPDDRAMVTYLGSIASLRADDVDRDVLRNCAHLHVASFFLQRGLQPGLAGLFRDARSVGMSISLDFGWDPDERWLENPYLSDVLAEADYGLPNAEELRGLSRADNWRNGLKAMYERFGGIFIVKLGADGAALVQDGKIIHKPAYHVDAVDTTGAGDAFNAGFVYAHVIEGYSPGEALEFANACGAMATMVIGGTTDAPSATDVRKWMASHGHMAV